MEENLHITKQTHQQKQITNVSREKKMKTKEKFNMQSTKTTVTPILLHAQDIFPVMCKGSKKAQIFLLMTFSKYHQQSP
jgi:hypothetical protein